MTDKKIGDLKKKVIDFELENGKVAKIGSITMGIMVRIEEDYGSFSEFQKVIANCASGAPGSFRAMADIFWLLCKNKEDVAPSSIGDELSRKREFMDQFPLDNIGSLAESLKDILSTSMPKASKSAKAGKTGKKPRSGSTTS